VTAPSLLRPDNRPLLYAVAAIVAALAAIAFVLSFSALRDLAVAAHVSVERAWLWPLAVDGNIVVNTVAGLLLRPRGRTVSWYPWAALFLFSAVSVLGNGCPNGLVGAGWPSCSRRAQNSPGASRRREHQALGGDATAGGSARAARGGSRHHLDVRLVLEQLPQTTADALVVVEQEHTRDRQSVLANDCRRAIIPRATGAWPGGGRSGSAGR
jgi:hypothetical protein